MRQKLIVANWKMFKTQIETENFIERLKTNCSELLLDRRIVICPPFTTLSLTQELLRGSRFYWGSQDVFWEEEGAFTGEISPRMLIDLGCSYAIIGHSERRQYFGEDDSTVNRKVKAAVRAGLIPILCIGEQLSEREHGDTFRIVERQLRGALSEVSPDNPNALVIAYEPVWAIGTGKNATPEQAVEVHRFIRKLLGNILGDKFALEVSVLYGGSVKPENVYALFKEESIDGGLVGGASLKVESFVSLVNYEQQGGENERGRTSAVH